MTGQEGGPQPPVPSGTVTFLFTDIEGSTQRWDRDPAAMQKSVRLHDRLMREAIAAHNGYVFKTVGDAFCAAFATPESAAAAALDAQRSVAAADFSGVGGLRVRMAINTGTADERQGDYFGPAVNRVARLLSLGHGGQVLLSGVAAGMVRENAPPESTLIELGAHELKDLKGQEHVFQLAAPGLQSEFPPLRSQTTLQPWLFPEAVRTRYFTGRRDLLASVGEHLATRHRAALSGLGGVGKTQACIEYAVRHRKDYPGGVFWVNAETAGDLTRGFVEIAGALRLTDAASKDQEKIVLSVLDWLGGNDRWLLILDNVDDRREVRRFVPERGKGDILITSRESVFQELGIPRALEVRDLDDDEAMHFLLTRTGRESVEPAEAASAAELAKELGKLPLALEQAAAYVAETGASFLDYLSAYRKRRMALLERAKTLVSHDTVSVTWAANFAAVAAISPASADALRIAAFVAPDAVPFDLFSRGAKAMGGPIAEALWEADELAVAEVLRPLARYSLIRSDAKLRTFGVHRLVQEIVRSAIPETDLREFVERAVRGLNATFPEVEFDTWSTCDQLIPHVVALGSWVDAHKLASEEAARVFDLAARYLVERGRYVEAKPLLDRALWTAERALGPEHAAVGRTTHNIGTYHLFNARYVEAQRLFERALAIRERALGADHPDVASTLNGLANSFWHRGRYAEAQPLYARALAIWEGALGSDSPFVATSLNNLATVLSAQGRYAESLAMDQRALAIREHALPPGHPHIALSLNNIADDYRKLGRRAEAESLMRRSLAMRESALGPDHREVRESLNTLAAILADQGRYSEAKPIYERALAASERSLGLDNPDAAEPLAGLANLELKEGRHDEAQRLLERALSVAERGLGPEHPDLAVSLIALAHIHAIGRRYAEAEPLLERAQAIYERQFGPEHHGVAAALAGLASLRERQGRTAEAIPLLEQALAIERQTFGDEHPHVAEIGKHLEELRLREVGDAAVAES